MKVAGLFAGIGGLEQGLAQAGHESVYLCEIWEPARAVLASNMPDVPCDRDVRDIAMLPSETELLAAGFPCQDLSQAGLTAGISGARSGLVGEVFRLIDKQRVPWVVLENVSFMLQLDQGRAMRTLIDAFEDRGYRWAYRVVNSLAFLPQRRERVLFLATNSEVDPASVLFTEDVDPQIPETDLQERAHGFYWTEGLGGLGWAVDAVPTLKNGSTIGIPSPPAILMPDGNLIKPGIRDVERMQGFAADWTAPAEQVARTAARWGLVGSAVSVPVAHWVGRRLKSPGVYDMDRDIEFSATGRLARAARFDGRRRTAVRIGTDPLGLRPPGLVEFLRDDPGQQLLSLKATLGFLGRTRRAKLRFEPGFIEAVERHAVRMGGVAPPRAARQQLDLLEAA